MNDVTFLRKPYNRHQLACTCSLYNLRKDKITCESDTEICNTDQIQVRIVPKFTLPTYFRLDSLPNGKFARLKKGNGGGDMFYM